MKKTQNILILLLAALLIFGCKAEDSDENTDSTPLAGNFVDDYKGTHTISSTSWVSGSFSFALTKTDADKKYFIAQNDASNDYSPSKYSRFDWAEDSSGQLYYCQSAYDKDSAEEAEAVTTSDSTDPSQSGCSDFAWTKLTAFSELVGTFVDGYKGEHTISATQWVNGTSSYTLTKNDTTQKYIIAKNGANNDYNPSKYSRFDWVKDSSDQLYYCQSAYDKETADDAEAVTVSDSSDPANSGCGESSFSWSTLTQ